MIKPDDIPQFTGDLGQLEQHICALRSEADGIRQAGAAAHTRFQGLSAFYQAPEADDLFASTAPVRDGADGFADKVATIAGALTTYAIEVTPVIARLKNLQSKAATFVAGQRTSSGAFDDDWMRDQDKVDEHAALMNDVAAAQAAFTAAEIAANNTITALVGGTQYVMNTGDKQFIPRGAELYGYSAEVLQQAQELPWGTPVSTSHRWWDPDDLGYYSKSFLWDGLIVDNVWGTVDGVATLVGLNGADAASGAWTGLVRGLLGAETYLMEADGRKPTGFLASDYVQDSKVYAKEFGKSFVAWDTWKENPARAAATVVFNGLTLGAGPLKIASAGRAGTAAKVASVTARIGDAIDPVSAAARVTTRGIPRIAEVTANLRGVNDIPDLRTPHSVLELADGSKVRIEDGTFIPVDKHGHVIHDAPRQEATAEARATPEETPARQREPAGVGAASRTPGATAHVGEASGRAGASHPVGPGTPRSGAGPLGNGHAGSGSGGLGSGGLDDVGRAGDDAVSGLGHAGDEAVPPTRPGDEGTGNGGHGGERELTAAERKQIQDEHIRKANDPDQTWFKEHYDTLGRRRHLLNADGTTKLVDGVELPQLAKTAGNKWVAAHELPSGPSEIRHGRTPLGPDSVDPVHRSDLNEATKNRRVSMDLAKAERVFADSPSAATKKALEDAQNAYHQQLGDLPNNSKISEKLGEKAAELHVAPHEFPNAEWVELPKTSNGANMFDQVYKLGNSGDYLIVEAKAPKGELDWRNGAGDAARGMRVKQGTKLYVETILEEMWKRGPEDVRIADDLSEALEKGKLQYVLVKANDHAGTSYAGAMLEHFKIY